MNNQENWNNRSRLNLRETPPIVVKPRTKPGDGVEGSDDFLGINLPSSDAVVQTGDASEWTLSYIPVTVPIDSITIFEGDDLSEENLNCLTFQEPKRIEYALTDDPDAPAYLVIQEIVENNQITGWQLYAPNSFVIVSSPQSSGEEVTWQYSASKEPISLKQIRLYADCNVSIESPPPSGLTPIFQKVTTSYISEVDVWE